VQAVHPQLQATQRKQRTIQKKVSFSGLGIHTGKEVTMHFCPAAENFGVVFKRIDLPDQPIIPASIEYVCDTARSTTIGKGKVRIHTVEHVLAAVRALEIDNLCIEVSNLEPPVSDGSSQTFVKMIEDGGICEQQAMVSIYKLESPIYWSEGDIHLVALPYDGYRISYTLNYPEPKVLKAQFHSILLSASSFKKEIAPCRTFARYEELAQMMDQGLIKGGSLDNAVVIHGDVVFSREGLHFSDEMVRHKILDIVGDLSLVGYYFQAHIIAIRSGHSSNYQLAKKLYHYLESCHPRQPLVTENQ
jgi:UDP-3-O-[3-hydroxymyristoyl] N-acetylglucosamine deacetylase